MGSEGLPPSGGKQALRDSRVLGLKKRSFFQREGWHWGGGNGGYLRNMRKMGGR